MQGGVVVPGSRAGTIEGPGGPLQTMLAVPEADPPPGGFPLLCLLDGATTFATAADTLRVQSGRPALTGIGPAVLLALQHPGDRAARDEARRRDYADPAGAAALLRVIEHDLLPALPVPLDRGRLGLFGHSLAGLLPLHALLSGGGPFRRFVAASPSLWWNGAALLAAAGGAAPPAEARLLLTIGGLERAGTALPTPDPARAERMRRARMAENLAELAAILSPRMSVTTAEFPDENHGSVLPAAIARAVPFALRAA